MKNILETLTKQQTNNLLYKTYKKDAIIFHENDTCKNIGIVIKGKVCISTYLENGDEVIFNLLDEDDIFGNNLVFSSKPYYKGDIVAKQETTICFIDKRTLIKLLRTNEAFLIKYLEIQSNFGKELNNRIKLLSMNEAKERLLFYLHINNNTINYTSISALANILFLKRETLSRLINKLERSKIIIRKDKTIIRLEK
ncbi:MAG: Crp/Fnr family transcriptional regulator [Erysipelotrichaceae bacterium]|nr:Crp/Fnr family transcriptional regulator [Erysipelotrichaceae bacterium]